MGQSSHNDLNNFNVAFRAYLSRSTSEIAHVSTSSEEAGGVNLSEPSVEIPNDSS